MGGALSLLAHPSGGPLSRFAKNMETTLGGITLFIYQACEIVSIILFIIFTFVVDSWISIGVVAFMLISVILVFTLQMRYRQRDVDIGLRFLWLVFSNVLIFAI